MSALRGSGISRRRMLRITAMAGVSMGLGGGMVAMLRRGRLNRITGSRIRMGTEVSISVLHPDPGGAREIVLVAFREIERLESILSRHRAEGPLAVLAREGRIDDAAPELLELLIRSRELSEATGGAFDVTVLPLLQLHQARGAEGRLPRPDELEAVLSLVDYRAVRIEGRSIVLDRPGMGITLDGIAKGFIVDRAIAVLRAAGAERVTVDAGGDLAASGDPGGRGGWPVAIRDPEAPDRLRGTVHLRAAAVATSGDYVQAFSPDRTSHHILDPRTGRSVSSVRAVTVAAECAMAADALSTTAFVLGPDAGLQLLEGRRDAEGILFSRDGRELRSSGFPAWA